MNHFIMLVILSLGIGIVFTLITKDALEERVRYFVKMMLYMVVGSFVASWVMSAIPW